MSANYEKLKKLLTELFQLDQAELDFGIYRIMNQKRSEIVQFLDKDLLPQVKHDFVQYQPADKDELQKELDKVIAGIKDAGMDPEQSPKVKELRAKLAGSVDITALENEVFSDLYNFFRRYYDKGDFISMRRYKEGVYAIPYEGEEVKLYWANHDQYYIKTSEYFHNYSFRLPSGKRVCFFKLIEADVEKDNIKTEAGKERRFILTESEPLKEENHELIVRFEYRPDAQKRDQKTINEETVKIILGYEGFKDWQQELARLNPTEKNPNRTLLEKHLTDYTARNTFDYFIHKDLRKFLRRELDFYIKNEIMHLDDIEDESVSRAEQYLSKIKVIRKIAHKIIEFLAQIENFQKKLWLKKKFVVETNYCVTLDRVPKALYPEIVENGAQSEEWIRLFAIDEIKGNQHTPAYSKPLTIEFLKANPFLALDTKFFNQEFKDKLIASFENLDEQCDGLLMNSENFQALSMLLQRYKGQVKCSYIDPPYNKENDRSFAYKDSFRHSSWLTMVWDRISLSCSYLTTDGILFSSIDDHEVQNLTRCAEQLSLFKGIKMLPAITNLKGNYDAEGFVATHEYVLVFTKGPLSTVGELPIDEEKIENDWSEDEYGLWKQGDGLRRTGEAAPREQRPKGWFPIFISIDSKSIYVTEDDTPLHSDDLAIWPVNDDGAELSWTWRKVKITNEAHNLLLKENKGRYTIYKKQRGGIDGLPSRKAKSFLYSPEYSSTTGGNLAKDIFGYRMSEFTPKAVKLLSDLIILGSNDSGIIIDYFAGSGTTGHAVINLNRENGGNRKYILVEMGGYFNTVLKQRIQKVIYSKDWKDGKPLSREGSSQMFKYICLESYEDTLNNLEVKRTEAQQSLLEQSVSFRESYMLSYMLDIESRGSLLNVKAFDDPFNYKLNISTGTVGETKPVNVDLVETFNYLIGLTVKHIDNIRGVKVIEGTNPKGQKTLVLWRKIHEMDNDKLDAWFKKQGYNTKDMEYDLIYVNGDNNLENLRRDDMTWKGRLIEEEFHRLMFDIKDV